MRAIVPGIYHWTSFHEGIGAYVHSYFVEATAPAVLIDPRLPEKGIGWFDRHQRPAHAYLTNRHHYRHSDQFARAYGTTIWCQKEGLHEFGPDPAVRGFRHGEELPGGIQAIEVGVLCPEETALLVPVGGGALAIGDAIVRYDHALGFVPDALMGRHPAAVKKGLRKVFRHHLELDFRHLLFAHGAPIVNSGKTALRHFLDQGE